MKEPCPECGSYNGEFVSVIEGSNTDGRTVELKCRDCGEYYSYDEYEGDEKE